MKKAIVLFDLDGTLIDSTEAILESFRVSFEALGDPVPPAEAIKELIGKPLGAMFADLGIAPDRHDACIHIYRDHYRRISREKTRLLPGARDAVEHAAAIAHLGIVTTKNHRASRTLMEHFGLMRFFGPLVGAEDVRHPKPDPEPIRKAIEALPSVTGGHYLIGDTCIDMEAAHNAKIEGMGVLCGYGTRSALARCTRNLFENAAEAVSQIAKA